MSEILGKYRYRDNGRRRRGPRDTGVCVSNHQLGRSTWLSRRQARLQAGLPIKSQRAFQHFANSRHVVIELRPTNPESVPHLENGALYKPEEVKPKTIKDADVLLGVPPSKKGLVGFFPEGPPKPLPGLSEPNLQIAWARYQMREIECRNLAAKMRELARKPPGLGRYEVIDHVVYGYTAENALKPVAADHDIYDIYAPNGQRLAHDEHARLIDDMLNEQFGVMHGPVSEWSTQGSAEREMRRKLMEQAQQEGVIRFAPHEPMRWTSPSTLWTPQDSAGHVVLPGSAAVASRLASTANVLEMNR